MWSPTETPREMMLPLRSKSMRCGVPDSFASFFASAPSLAILSISSVMPIVMAPTKSESITIAAMSVNVMKYLEGEIPQIPRILRIRGRRECDVHRREHGERRRRGAEQLLGPVRHGAAGVDLAAGRLLRPLDEVARPPVRPRVAAEDVDVHHVGPVLERRDAEEREHRDVERAEVPRVVLAEEHDTDDGKHVKEDEENQADEADARSSHDERAHNHLQLGQRFDELEHPQQPEQPQQDDQAAAARGGPKDDDDVECVPARAQHAHRLVVICNDLEHDLDREYGRDDLLEDVEERLVLLALGEGLPLAHLLVAFEVLPRPDADLQPGDDDDHRNEALELGTFGNKIADIRQFVIGSSEILTSVRLGSVFGPSSPGVVQVSSPPRKP